MSENKNTSKKVLIITITVLSLIIIGLVIAVFILSNKSTSESNDSSATDIITTTETTTTNETTITTTTTKTITMTTTTTVVTTTRLNPDDYLGYWQIDDQSDWEIEIHDMNESSVTFTWWVYRIWSIDEYTALLNGNTAEFSTDFIHAILTFDKNCINLSILESDITGIPSSVEIPFALRADESLQYTISSHYDSPSTTVPTYVETETTTVVHIDGNMGYDPFNEDIPNVYCPNCGYGFFETGLGSDGFFCPSCGHNWMPY